MLFQTAVIAHCAVIVTDKAENSVGVNRVFCGDKVCLSLVTRNGSAVNRKSKEPSILMVYESRIINMPKRNVANFMPESKIVPDPVKLVIDCNNTKR